MLYLVMYVILGDEQVEEFDEGNLVAIFGGELGKDSQAANDVTLCNVLIVGQNDLAVECQASYSTTYHVVPKDICSKMYLDPKTLSSARALTPQIGDLVISFSRNITASELVKTSGILYKIIYKLGQPDKCDLLCGTEMVTVSWKNLIVIHRSES